MTAAHDSSSLAGALRFEGELSPDDRDLVLERFAPLEHRLRSYRPDSISLVLTVKEREQPSQRTTLEAKIGGLPRVVATSHRPTFDAALLEVRDDMIRQLTDQKNRSEPRHNRHLRNRGD